MNGERDTRPDPENEAAGDDTAPLPLPLPLPLPPNAFSAAATADIFGELVLTVPTGVLVAGVTDVGVTGFSTNNDPRLTVFGMDAGDDVLGVVTGAALTSTLGLFNGSITAFSPMPLFVLL